MNDFLEQRERLATLVGWIHQKGWAPGTAGNYSVVVSEAPLWLLMTPSGVDKGAVRAEDLLLVDHRAAVLEGDGKPSAEALIHVALADTADAKVILHTHSVANTLLSFLADGFSLEGYEMLKALAGVATHEHSEFVPILDNSQEMDSFSEKVRRLITEWPGIHCFLMRGHGLYTWGEGFFEAKRHLEAFEFVFEIEARRRGL